MTPCTGTALDRAQHRPAAHRRATRAASSSRSSDATGTFDAESREIQAALARQAGQVLRRVRLQEELAHRALHDQLTGLANRKLLEERLDAAIAGGHPQRAAALGRVPGPRRLQGDQRQPRPPGRRRRARRGRRRDSGRWPARATRSPGTAATSSSSSARTPRRRPLRPSPSDSARRSRRPLECVPPQLRRRGEHRGRRLGAGAGARRRTPTCSLRLADEAMYASKDAGRDRVTMVTVDDGTTHGSDPSTRPGRTRPEAAWEH